MFSRSRRKIILSIMGSLILLFVVTLSVIMIASYQEIRKKNTEMLKHYMELYSDKQQTENIEKAATMFQQENTAPVADGTYEVNVKTDSTMFHINEAHKGIAYDDSSFITTIDAVEEMAGTEAVAEAEASAE